MRLLKRSILGAAVSAALCSAPVYASTLFTSDGFTNITNPAVNGWCSACSWEPSYKVFDTFSLSSAASLTGVDFAVTESWGLNWNIEISILDSTRTTTVFSHVYAPGDYSVTSMGSDVAKVSASLPSVALSGGSYWMSWYDPANLAIPGYSAPGGQLYQGLIGTHVDQVAAFQLTGNVAAVPEPETYAMMLAGLGVMGFIGKRRRKAI